MSDLFGNHIVGFPMRRLKLNTILTALVDLCCSFEGRVSPGSSGLSVAVMYKTYSLNVS